MSKRKCSDSATEGKVCTVGDAIPDVELHYGFPPEKISLKERVGDQKVILVSLPGAFTPT